MCPKEIGFALRAYTFFFSPSDAARSSARAPAPASHPPPLDFPVEPGFGSVFGVISESFNPPDGRDAAFPSITIFVTAALLRASRPTLPVIRSSWVRPLSDREAAERIRVLQQISAFNER